MFMFKNILFRLCGFLRSVVKYHLKKVKNKQAGRSTCLYPFQTTELLLWSNVGVLALFKMFLGS